jgi:hypothetical protein
MEAFDYLKQNANDMATVVETYLVEETVDLIYDGEKLDKWNNLVAELGLKGQNSIRHPEKSPIPFQPMNEQLKATFETLCPTSVSVENYNASSIPVEILSLLSLSRKENYFHEIKIWYDEKQKDPVCLGIKHTYRIQDSKGHFHNDSTEFDSKQSCQDYINEKGIDGKPYKMWGEKYWLIGRWADVKKSFAELKAMAKERFMFEQKTSLLQEIKNKQRDLDDLELSANVKFGI